MKETSPPVVYMSLDEIKKMNKIIEEEKKQQEERRMKANKEGRIAVDNLCDFVDPYRKFWELNLPVMQGVEEYTRGVWVDRVFSYGGPNIVNRRWICI